MTRSIRLRRALAPALILTAILTLSPTSPTVAAQAAERVQARYSYTPDRICDIDWRDGVRKVKRLIRCAANHWGVDVSKALYVADRESHFRPRAYNAYSCAKGIYQHICTYWPGRAFKFGFKGRSAFNGRANIIVSMKMVARNGWSPWGG